VAEQLSRLIGLDEAAKALGVSVYSVRRFVTAGALRGVKIGGRVMCSVEEIARAQKEGLAVPRPGELSQG
jgi:excisionase family DNA binding protein